MSTKDKVKFAISFLLAISSLITAIAKLIIAVK